MHPLTTQETMMTDALNATTLTYNGNEWMLQNDMGNTRIQDAVTGSIMGLHPGFVPLGMKERGGVMYIVSMNKEGVGEIGSIPSPHITYSGFEDPYVSGASSEEKIILTEELQSKGSATTDEEKLLSPGDPFIVCLSIDPDSLPLISTAFEKKYYKVKLFAITGAYGEIDLEQYITGYTQQMSSDTQNPDESEYWFSTKDINSQLERLNEMNQCLYYPNIPDGKLCIKIVPEEITNFNFGPTNLNKNYSIHCPVVYSKNGLALVQMQSFIYDSDSAWRIKVLKIRVAASDTKAWDSSEQLLDIKMSNGSRDADLVEIKQTAIGQFLQPVYYESINNISQAVLKNPTRLSVKYNVDNSSIESDSPIYLNQDDVTKATRWRRMVDFGAFA